MQTKSGLTTKLAKGDPVAFRDIFNLLYPRMMGYCKLFVKDHFQAEDLVQDCFVQLWNKRESLDPKRNIDSLLFVMLRNHCLNFLRDNRLDNTTIELNSQHISEVQYLYHLDFIGEEEKPLEEHLITSLKEAIDNLPDRQKEVFLKTKVGGQSQKEVATELGITVKAIEKNVAAAKKRIRDELARKFPTLAVILLFLLQ